MAKKAGGEAAPAAEPQDADLAREIIKSLNREFKTRIAYNLSEDESPAHVKSWISTGSKYLDVIVSNRADGGFPVGRIVEIAGPPSSGKSHIAFHVAKRVQELNGLVVYIDSENAVPVPRLAELGLDVSKRFVYADTHCTEEVFSISEAVIARAGAVKSEAPILIVWDSVAATSPRAELEGEMDDQQMGLQARVIAKGFRKLTGLIAQRNVLFLCLNQVKTKVGVVFGNPEFTPGGNAIPFHASVRIKLSTAKQIKVGEEVVGVTVKAQTIKNKVSRPFRSAHFSIIFGQGISESEQVLEVLAQATKEKGGIATPDCVYEYEAGGWRKLRALGTSGAVLYEKRFQKSDTPELMRDPTFSGHVIKALEAALAVPLDLSAAAPEGEQPDGVKALESGEG